MAKPEHRKNNMQVLKTNTEVDEEFRFVQRQLKETVRELLRVFLQGAACQLWSRPGI